MAMKYIVIFWLSAWFGLASGNAFSDSVTETRFRWCAFFNWPPWIYKTPEKYDASLSEQQSSLHVSEPSSLLPESLNGYQGILIEQLLLFKRLHPDFDFQMREIDSWKRCQESVASGATDFILGANKTEERQKKFHYLSEPAFINRTFVGVYSAKHSILPNIHRLEDLQPFVLAKVRGDSYGKPIDDYIRHLRYGENKIELSTQNQVMKFVALQRADYFLMPTANFSKNLESLLRAETDHSLELSFKEIYRIERAVPVYLAFSKQTAAYERLESAWLATLREYYQTVDHLSRVAYHKALLNLE